MPPTPLFVFKICARSDWDAAVTAGTYSGSHDDVRDGFIHFSGADQVRATAAKFFSGQPDLVLVAIDVAKLGAALNWEPSRGGQLFPHLYAALDVAAARWVRPLALGPDGVPVIAEDIDRC